jgi:hypothetical protein
LARKGDAVSEHSHQCALFAWARNPATLKKYPALDLLEGSANGVKMSITQAVGMKRAGMLKGSHDITLKVARGGFNGLSIELKKPAENGKAKGVLSAEQKWYGARLEQEGWSVHVCWGWGSARDVIENYLSL